MVFKRKQFNQKEIEEKIAELERKKLEIQQKNPEPQPTQQFQPAQFQQPQPEPQSVQTIKSEPVQYEPFKSEQQPQQQSIVESSEEENLETDETIVILKQTTRRLRLIEQQLTDRKGKKIMEDSAYMKGRPKYVEELLNEADDLKLTIDRMTNLLIQNGFSEQSIKQVTDEALGDITTYKFVTLMQK